MEPLRPKVRTFWENDSNKSCRDHEGLSFSDLELNLEDHLKSILNFLNPFFDPRFEKRGKFDVQMSLSCQ